MTDMDPYLHDVAHQLNNAMADLQDAYLIRFFGSKEQAELAAPYFEIEKEPVDLEFEQEANLVRFKMISQFRLKLKEGHNFTDIPRIGENDEQVR